ncbi:TOPRIM nucleotidyl transferase/hydrolase domain-containing protein [Bradyrhizobium altum]|uniref:TOPRIM nucleotidyl transferase/hydrolase domain-containing protein n=1 Tax=Bradyrhizobium altum TaxID=1571202 RepID=UPI0035DE8B3B
MANDFGVNPKPQLVLFVEGGTELMVVPMLFDRMYATTLGVFGIELVSVRGVSNATGGS